MGTSRASRVTRPKHPSRVRLRRSDWRSFRDYDSEPSSDLTPESLPGAAGRTDFAPGDESSAKRFMHFVTERDIRRVEALRRAILTRPEDTFADQVWLAVSRGFGVNAHDPILRERWGGCRPPDRELMRFMVLTLSRVAPEMLSTVRVQCAGFLTSFGLEAMNTLVHWMRNPPVGPNAAGARVSLDSAYKVLELLGIAGAKGGVQQLLIQQNVNVEQKTSEVRHATEEELAMVEQARQQLYDSMIAQTVVEEETEGAASQGASSATHLPSLSIPTPAAAGVPEGSPTLGGAASNGTPRLSGNGHGGNGNGRVSYDAD